MKRKLQINLIIILAIVCITACGKAAQQQYELEPNTISGIYPGNIIDVDKIELVDGSTGDRKTIIVKKEIETILDEIKDIMLEPERDQEGSVGYIFRIILYEKNVVKMNFTPLHIQGIYYETNEDLVSKMKEIFEKHFERNFQEETASVE